MGRMTRSPLPQAALQWQAIGEEETHSRAETEAGQGKCHKRRRNQAPREPRQRSHWDGPCSSRLPRPLTAEQSALLAGECSGAAGAKRKVHLMAESKKPQKLKMNEKCRKQDSIIPSPHQRPPKASI